MEEKLVVTDELQELIDKIEELGWTFNGVTEEESTGRCFVELENYSPAGEDLCESIEFEKDDQVDSFLSSLWDLYDGFDIDDHVEMWIEARQNNRNSGIPSARVLVNDAEAIDKMYEQLWYNADKTVNELTKEA